MTAKGPTAIAEQLRTHKPAIYTATVVAPVFWGNAKTDNLAECVALVESCGYKLISHTTVYAEKIGQNNLIHTLIFRRSDLENTR